MWGREGLESPDRLRGGYKVLRPRADDKNGGDYCLNRFGDQLSLAVAGHDLAVVADVDETLQAFEERVGGIDHKVGVVDDQRIEVVAGFEAAHLSEEAA